MEAKNTADIDKLDACFAQDAVIHDVGEDNKIIGLDAIKRFTKASKEKYDLTVTIQHIDNTGERLKITTLASGNFPGSPQYFHYEFTMVRGLIQNIDILPGDASNE
jgi:hypothetical protein